MINQTSDQLHINNIYPLKSSLLKTNDIEKYQYLRLYQSDLFINPFVMSIVKLKNYTQKNREC